MKTSVMYKEVFYCHSKGFYVVCNAPYQCYEECNKYRAIQVTGVKVRQFTCDTDKHATIALLTGFIEGNKLVEVKPI